ncbi:MAG: RidA family protein [Anaerolineaceae bacterium]|nr:RidA family protein [Anaerolineaceae bacterium]
MTEENKKEVLVSSKAPKAVGPYSLGIRAGGFLFLSGQLGLDPDTGTFVEGGIEEQTRQALLNIENVLKESGGDLSGVVKTSVFLRDINDFPKMNAVYAEFFNNDPPARSTMQVGALPKQGLVEIEVIAKA